ncbi:hypothetical protein AMTR_s00045p00167670 [Amborella trichopoda]|uniref:Uncharacterized protein n=1 Tax=Amborella trichopoda TaxID=13333 RepID=W1P572_AMBTC|nr:hypothetical protein AMTR_s00045p00167670 [Amborella trichopoda]
MSTSQTRNQTGSQFSDKFTHHTLGFHESETLSGSSSPINSPPISGLLNDQEKVPIADILDQTDRGTSPKKEKAYPISLAYLEILQSYSKFQRHLSGSCAVKQSTNIDTSIGGERKPSTQYDRAKTLLMLCDFESSPVGNPVQRLVFHFADALWEKVERETGMKSLKPECIEGEADVDEVFKGYHPAVLATYKAVPFAKLLQFTASQVIISALASATKIHLIDLEARTGMHWSMVMQSLSERSKYPVELLKITMVGDSGERMEETDMREELFELDREESVPVFGPLVLRALLVKPHCLEKMIRIIRNLCLDIMVLTEVEGKHNSPSFVNRFIEALFYYSAYFDSLDAFIEAADSNRLAMEGTFMASAMRNMVVREGRERVIRNVGLDTWRLFLNREGFEEVEVSEDALYQAKLIVESYSHSDSVSLEMNGKAMTVGWKGTPLHSISAWRCF